MHRNISLITRLAVAITVAALSSHGEARAQVRNLPTNPQGTLQLGESGGGPRGYAFRAFSSRQPRICSACSR